jgi:hypothetical protein
MAYYLLLSLISEPQIPNPEIPASNQFPVFSQREKIAPDLAHWAVHAASGLPAASKGSASASRARACQVVPNEPPNAQWP